MTSGEEESVHLFEHLDVKKTSATVATFFSECARVLNVVVVTGFSLYIAKRYCSMGMRERHFMVTPPPPLQLDGGQLFRKSHTRTLEGGLRLWATRRTLRALIASPSSRCCTTSKNVDSIIITTTPLMYMYTQDCTKFAFGFKMAPLASRKFIELLIEKKEGYSDWGKQSKGFQYIPSAQLINQS